MYACECKNIPGSMSSDTIQSKAQSMVSTTAGNKSAHVHIMVVSTQARTYGRTMSRFDISKTSLDGSVLFGSGFG
jgi:hypothetical protein